MGFPFDRPSTEDVVYLDDFLLPNMARQDITIKYTNRVIEKARP